MVHDNQIYGLTKKQASPTSPRGTRSNTTPRGSFMEGLNPLTVTLGVQNVSFVAQAADWIPEVLFDIIHAAFHHDGLSFIRIVQRCPEWMPDNFEPWLHDPSRVQLLVHDNALSVSSDSLRSIRIVSNTTRPTSTAPVRSPPSMTRFRSGSYSTTRASRSMTSCCGPRRRTLPARFARSCRRSSTGSP